VTCVNNGDHRLRGTNGLDTGEPEATRPVADRRVWAAAPQKRMLLSPPEASLDLVLVPPGRQPAATGRGWDLVWSSPARNERPSASAVDVVARPR
jgi:hypothetical protein